MDSDGVSKGNIRHVEAFERYLMSFESDIYRVVLFINIKDYTQIPIEDALIIVVARLEDLIPDLIRGMADLDSGRMVLI